MFKILFAKQKKLPWKPKKDRGAKPCLSRFPRELRVRCFARDARPIRPSARLLFPIATPHQRRDGCWAIHLYVFHCTSLRQLKQYQFSRSRSSEPISAHKRMEKARKSNPPHRPESNDCDKRYTWGLTTCVTTPKWHLVSSWNENPLFYQWIFFVLTTWPDDQIKSDKLYLSIRIT